MSEVVRLYRYKSLLSGRRAVSAEELMASLEISRATFKRDMAKLRDQLHVPIEFNRESGGYQMGPGHSDSELPGLLGAKLRPLQDRLTQLMDKHGLASQDVAKCIRIVQAGKRVVIAKSFEAVAAATLARKRLKIWHFSRQNGKTTAREVSPQRLVHYRDNWYLDAWCHLRDDIRSFSIDAVTRFEVLDVAAKEVVAKRIDEAVGAGYGIFNGAPKAWATLKFTPERARWVSGETWHPNQRSFTEADGSYVLELPYSDERELMGDLLRFGADVEVLAPPDLRSRIKRALHEAVGKYL